MRVDPDGYEISRKIKDRDYPFYALLMAAMRQADSENSARLKAAFPETWEYLRHCYNCAGCQECGRER